MSKRKDGVSKRKEVPLLVTTAHKGVFFGYGVPTDASTIKLTRARMCVYWSQDVKGVIGLAAMGPNKNCKVTPAAPLLILRDVTSVSETTKEAAQAWEAGPWKLRCMSL